MAITGHLSEFSLAEIFQFLEQGQKSGLLTIAPLPEPKEVKASRTFYIWFQHGQVVAAANRSDGQGLMTLISQRGWLGDRAASRLIQSCNISQPAGLCLKSQGILQAEQLKLLFYVQVMQQVCTLFTLQDGWFHFDSHQKIPNSEKTGLSAPATDVTLAGLRALKNWNALQDKLPDPDSGLICLVEGKPNQKLNQVEWQLWEFTDGKTSLREIAKNLSLPIEKLQQIAFRLIVVSLIEETPIIPDKPERSLDLLPSTPDSKTAESDSVSQSFLQSLVGFLSGKV